jgi:carboxyl-terminal processing protease
MTSRTRLLVLVVSTPVIAFAIIGGYLGQAMTQDQTVRNLRIFDDVVELVVENYVESVDMRKAMAGALRGMTDGLDTDSGYLTAPLVKSFESNAPLPAGDLGIDITRQYYLRIVSTRDGSPAHKAGLRAGDYIRAIDGRPTRDMAAFEGTRLLRGAPGSKVSLLVFRGNAAEPTEMALVRERVGGPDVTTRMANATTGYVRVVEFTSESTARLKQAFDALAKTGARRYIVDLRGTARGDLEQGIAASRLFVPSGTLTYRQTKTAKDPVMAKSGEATITAPVVLLTDIGTSGAAEIFAAALDGNNRAELIGERTLGRAARQQLVKLPDGSGLLLSSTRFLTPASEPIHEKGLTPDVPVNQPDVELGIEPPPGDPILEKALERLAEPKAA